MVFYYLKTTGMFIKEQDPQKQKGGAMVLVNLAYAYGVSGRTTGMSINQIETTQKLMD